MLKIIGRITSFNVQKVLWLADELKLTYEHVELGGKFGGLETEEFGKINQLRKVPVLIDGENCIWESHTILRYLVAKYGDSNWYPADAYQRSLYERWMDWSQTLFQPAFMRLFWGYYRKTPQNRNMDAVQIALDECFECLQILEFQLAESKYLVGSTMTVGDIPVGAVLYRLTEQGLDVTLPQSVNDWYEMLKQRDGYQKWVMSDFSELQGREEF